MSQHIELNNKLVVVNADDFGASSEINRAIIESFRLGLVSSTTIMTNMPGFDEACALTHTYKLHNQVGIHFNFTEGRPLTTCITEFPLFCASSGEFAFVRNHRFALTSLERLALLDECRAQIHRCFARGLTPTHADSHHHVHTEICIFAVIAQALSEFGIRCVRLSENVRPVPPIKWLYKAFFNNYIRRIGFITTDYFCDLTTLPLAIKIRGRQWKSIEVMVHPGYDPDGILVDASCAISLLKAEVLHDFTPESYPVALSKAR